MYIKDYTLNNNSTNYFLHTGNIAACKLLICYMQHVIQKLGCMINKPCTLFLASCFLRACVAI